MASSIPMEFGSDSSPSTGKLLSYLRDIRNIGFVQSLERYIPEQNILKKLTSLSTQLLAFGYSREAETLNDVYSLSILPADFGGLGLSPNAKVSPKEEAEVLFLTSAWLESLNSADRAKSPPRPLKARPENRRGMTLSEKIFAAHDIERRGELKPGDMVRVDVDWIMASELSWGAMENTYNSLGRPGIFRNDRFWLAGDHVVDPRIKEHPKVKSLVAASERAREGFRMTEYQGMNYTIMHTEFFRERAQPGMLIIGSDFSHLLCWIPWLSGNWLGVADVTIPLITGETWFKVPESVNIRLINEPSPGIGGKDTILYILKELKRNTVASDRVVEFTGPGVQHLSCDARFAITNMTTEFGGITGIFVPDQVTYDFVNHRKLSRYKKNVTYFRPDEDAQYASTHVIDLAQVESFVALYPSPDDVVPVSKVEGTHLDGCFIGACTTAEEDLIIGAMVLEAGMNKGLMPVKEGKRRIVPGSLPILNRLKELGFTDIYEKAGFNIGVPGCSYCIGMGADKAGVGEVWISSQNRNFENRMGTGSIGNLGSAATVAASSFTMKMTDPKPFLDSIDRNRLRDILGHRSEAASTKSVEYVEPSPDPVDGRRSAIPVSVASSESRSASIGGPIAEPRGNSSSSDIRRGKIQRLGDFIDTDALAPSESLTSCKTNEEFGAYCLKHTHPGFRSRVKEGYNVVVAGTAFGCGSSRENAVSALLGAGIICVIAKSFAFIYGRNQPNLGLLGINIVDESFYEAAVDGEEIIIDLEALRVRVAGQEWGFELSAMERELIEVGGIDGAFKRFGKRLFKAMCEPTGTTIRKQQLEENCASVEELQW